MNVEQTDAQKRRQSSPWLLIPLLIICLGVLTWANYHYLTGPARYASHDYMSLWAGGRAILEGLNPYDPAVWGPLRVRYGSEWIPDAQAPFPLWTLVLHIPFSLLDVGWGAAVWLTLSMALLGVCLFLLVSQVEQRPLSLGEFTLLAVGSFTFRGGLIAFRGGQITFVLLFILVLFLVLLKNGRPFWAGFTLAFVALKPNPFVLLVPLMGLWFLLRRKWRVVAGALVAGAILFAGSWAILPGWLFEWIDVREKTYITFMTPTLWGIAHDLTSEWWVLAGLLLVVGVTAVTGLLVFTNDEMDETAVISLAIVGSLLVTPYTWVYEHLLLLIPINLIYLKIENRWLARMLYLLLVMIFPWTMFQVAKERWGIGTLTMLVPLITGIIYYLIVRQELRHETIE